MQNQTIIKNFGVLYRTFVSYISKSVAEMDLSLSDSVFLINIGEREGISQEEISTELAIDKAAIARSVKSMEQKGYLLTKKSSYDRRTKELYLTQSGKVLYAQIHAQNEAWLKLVLGDLSPDEVSRFAETIDAISRRAKVRKQ